jgi:hypothetical protein
MMQCNTVFLRWLSYVVLKSRSFSLSAAPAAEKGNSNTPSAATPCGEAVCGEMKNNDLYTQLLITQSSL